MSVSLKSLLQNQIISASAPCRVDSGGTWDIKAIALPFEAIGPTTVNIALTLRTHVTLFPFKNNWIKISSQGFPLEEVFHKDQAPFNSSFGLFFAAVACFGFHGLKIHILSESPVRSALGGSSTALVALIKALSKASVLLGNGHLSAGKILHLGYHLEDGTAGGNCGIQDQAAAVYGGVNQWHWQFRNPARPFQRTPLLDREGRQELSKHLLVAYSGKQHVSSKTNRRWITDFLAGKTRSGWIAVNEAVHGLAEAIKERNWQKGAVLLREEMLLRKKITPEALVPVTEKLVKQAEQLKCGARFTGAGAGGALWAIGPMENLNQLRQTWRKTLAPIRGACLLDCRVDSKGVR